MVKRKQPIGITILAILSLLSVFPAFLMAILAGVSGPPDKTIVDRAIRILFMVSPLFFLAAGILLLRYKGETLSTDLDSSLICPQCKIIYDKSWKVCLKCGKPLAVNDESRSCVSAVQAEEP